MMEYGYEITDTAGNKAFFVEGCTYCSMSTGGLHEVNCPLYKPYKIIEYPWQSLLKECDNTK